MHIVLVEPEIPANTGNIARLCAANNFVLHLVRPLGFSTDSKHLKRAGLDYWDLVEIHYHDNIEAFLAQYPQIKFYLLTTKTRKSYAEVNFTEDTALIFGPETRGLSEKLLEKYPDRTLRIPMKNEARSLNLSNSVAIVSYEVMRQQKFVGLI